MFMHFCPQTEFWIKKVFLNRSLITKNKQNKVKQTNKQKKASKKKKRRIYLKERNKDGDGSRVHGFWGVAEVHDLISLEETEGCRGEKR